MFTNEVIPPSSSLDDAGNQIASEMTQLNARINKAGLAFVFALSASGTEPKLKIDLYKSDQRHPNILDTRYGYGSLYVDQNDLGMRLARQWMETALQASMNPSEKSAYDMQIAKTAKEFIPA